MKVLGNGLVVDDSTGRYFGYIFNFDGHGAFAPSGKVGELTPEQIECHNGLVAEAEMEGMTETGRAVLYLVEASEASGSVATVTNWTGKARFPVRYSKRSRHFVPNCCWQVWRTDVWFSVDGEEWHGVNIGDNDIVRCRRLKGGAK